MKTKIPKHYQGSPLLESQLSTAFARQGARKEGFKNGRIDGFNEGVYHGADVEKKYWKSSEGAFEHYEKGFTHGVMKGLTYGYNTQNHLIIPKDGEIVNFKNINAELASTDSNLSKFVIKSASLQSGDSPLKDKRTTGENKKYAVSNIQKHYKQNMRTNQSKDGVITTKAGAIIDRSYAPDSHIDLNKYIHSGTKLPGVIKRELDLDLESKRNNMVNKGDGKFTNPYSNKTYSRSDLKLRRGNVVKQLTF